MESFIDSLIFEISVEYNNDVFLVNIYTIILNRIKQKKIDPFDIAEVSSCLFISERTLHRRLKEKKSTYFKIKDDIRKKYSSHLLYSQEYTIERLSQLSFFGSSSSFIESFKRWHGCTPKKWIKYKKLIEDIK